MIEDLGNLSGWAVLALIWFGNILGVICGVITGLSMSERR